MIKAQITMNHEIVKKGNEGKFNFFKEVLYSESSCTSKHQITKNRCEGSNYKYWLPWIGIFVKKDRQDLKDSPKNGREFSEIGPKISQIWKDQVKM